jgi:hypothetical protein
MLDGFDEIRPDYKETVIRLLQALRQEAVEQLWVTTRPHLREELEDKIQQLSYTLEPFSGENQVQFLAKFWSLKDWFTQMTSEEKEKKVGLEIYAKHLIKRLANQSVIKTSSSPESHYNASCWRRHLMKKLKHFISQLSPYLSYRSS